MPTVKGPLMSVDAHGALAKALTFQRRPGGASVYGYKEPKVPLTDRQLWQRALIYWCVYAWQQLSPAEKAEWEVKAKGQRQSGYSFFLHSKRGYFLDPTCVLYLPLYDTRFQGSPFKSLDTYEHQCTVTGALWGPQGFTMDGVANKILIPSHSAFDFGTTGAFSFSIWFKSLEAKTVDARIAGRCDIGATQYWGFYTVSSELVWYANNNAATTAEIWDEEWHLLTGTRINGTAGKVFCDGAEVFSGTVSSSDNLSWTAPIALGAWGDFVHDYTKGEYGAAWLHSSDIGLLGHCWLREATKWRYQ